MARFTLTAFADESSRYLTEQIEVLKAHDIEYVELRGVNGKNIIEHSDEEARQVKAELDAAGIKVSSIGSPIGKTDLSEPFENSISMMERALSVCRIMDTKFIRVFSYYFPEGGNILDYKDETVSRLRRLAYMAGEQNVTLVHENEEAEYGEHSGDYRDLVLAVDSPYFRGLFDTANFVFCGERNVPECFENTKDLISYIHIKDVADKKYVAPGVGDGQIKEYLRAMLDHGYEGFISLEPHMTAFDGLEKLMKSSDFMPKNSGDGVEQFHIACIALKQILDELSSEAGEKLY